MIRRLTLAPFLLVLLGACGQAVPEAQTPEEAVYVAQCSACHGPGAAGTRAAPPLLDVVVGPPGTVDPAFRAAVLEGVDQSPDFGAMPALPISEQDLLAVADYLRSLGAPAG